MMEISLQGSSGDTTTLAPIVASYPYQAASTSSGLLGSSNMSGGDVMMNCSVSVDDKNDTYKHFYETARLVTGMFIYPSICFPGVVCNVLSIYVLTRRNMLSSTNAFLSALAVADTIKLLNDILYFMVTLFVHTSPRLGNLSYGYLYPYSHFVFNMINCVSSWLTVSVAVERYILVCHPTRARTSWSRRMAVGLSTGIFILMTSLALPSLFRYRTIRCFDVQLNASRLDVQVTSMWNNQGFVTSYTWAQNLIRSIIPLFILIILNSRILWALRKTSLKRRKSSRHRVNIMMLVVIIMFSVCITPDAILSTVFGQGYHEADYLIKGIREITDTLLALNAGVNFIIYCAFNKVFRRSFTKLCCPGRVHGKVTYGTEMDESIYRRLSEGRTGIFSGSFFANRQGHRNSSARSDKSRSPPATPAGCNNNNRHSKKSVVKEDNIKHHNNCQYHKTHLDSPKRNDSNLSDVEKAKSTISRNNENLSHEDQESSALIDHSKEVVLNEAQENCSKTHDSPKLGTSVDDTSEVDTVPKLQNTDKVHTSFHTEPSSDHFIFPDCGCSHSKNALQLMPESDLSKAYNDADQANSQNDDPCSDSGSKNGVIKNTKHRHRHSSYGLKKSRNSVKTNRAKRRGSSNPCSSDSVSLHTENSSGSTSEGYSSSSREGSRPPVVTTESRRSNSEQQEDKKLSRISMLVPHCIHSSSGSNDQLDNAGLGGKLDNTGVGGNVPCDDHQISRFQNCDGSGLVHHQKETNVICPDDIINKNLNTEKLPKPCTKTSFQCASHTPKNRGMVRFSDSLDVENEVASPVSDSELPVFHDGGLKTNPGVLLTADV